MLLGSKERHKDLIEYIRLDAGTIVFKIDDYPVIVIDCSKNADLCIIFSLNGIHCIHDQIDDHLINKIGISSDHQVRREYLMGTLNAKFIHFWSQQTFRALKYLCHPEISEVWFGNSGQVAVNLHKIQ